MQQEELVALREENQNLLKRQEMLGMFLYCVFLTQKKKNACEKSPS
jgi:hypothetical protein